MGDVVAFRKPRNKYIRSRARECLTDAISTAGDPKAVVVIVMGKNGRFAIRSAFVEDMQLFDVYARAETLAGREKAACIADE